MFLHNLTCTNFLPRAVPLMGVGYKNSSQMNTTTQARTDTLKRLCPNHASRIALIKAMDAAIGLRVAVMMAGNVMTDRVT